MGTLLDERGYALPAPVWSAKVLEEQPEVITGIHREYLEAGAELLTTVTFRTTKYVYEQVGKPGLAMELNYRAVQCASDAIGGNPDRFIAGSIAPVADCYRPDLVPEHDILYDEHFQQATWLADAGVDCLLFETMNTIREAEICGKVGTEIGIPFFVSLIAQSGDELPSGEPIRKALDAVAGYDPTGVLINCTSPEIITSVLDQHAGSISMPAGGYANMGVSEPEQGGAIEEVWSPADYVNEVAKWPKDNLVLIGGCCGSDPEHVLALAKYRGKE